MTFATLSKIELRNACKEFGVKNYGKMTNDEMRAALTLAQRAKWDAENDAQLMKDYGVTCCPSCGVHLSNGVGYDGDEVNGKTIRYTHEFACLGCGHSFGKATNHKSRPDSHTGKGLKIEKGREERNGVKRPSVGGKCRAIWDALDALLAELEEGETVTSKMVQDLAKDEGWNKNNASIEFYNWRKFNGIKGR